MADTLGDLDEVFAVPRNYGWVVLVGAGTILVNMFQIFMIGRMRRKYKIQVPAMWSDEHEQFNCAQRAHQNTLEWMPFFLINLAFSGLQYPIVAASFGLVFLVARIIFSIGYYIRPALRVPGFILTVLGSILPLVGLSVASAGRMLEWWDTD